MKSTQAELDRARRYRELNPEKAKEATRRWRENNKERAKATLKAWRLANKDKVEANRQRFHELNPNYKRSYQRKWLGTLQGRYLKLRHESKRRGYQLEITLDQYEEIVSHPCAYCGASEKSIYGYGLDRVDSKGGYTADNVVSCCPVCNWMKSDLSRAEFIEHIARMHAKLNGTAPEVLI